MSDKKWNAKKCAINEESDKKHRKCKWPLSKICKHYYKNNPNGQNHY